MLGNLRSGPSRNQFRVMRKFPISLTHRATSASVSAVEAWLLPGDEVEAWVRALCASGLPNLESQPLFLVPESRHSSAAAGLFVPLVQGGIEAPARALPYALEGGRIYVPQEAALRYPLTEAEFASHFLHDYVVLHPTIGVIAFDQAEALTLPELLDPPSPSLSLWNRAHPGLPAEPDKLTISVVEPPPELILQDRGDIGSKMPDQLPGYPNEPKDNVLKAGERALLRSIRNLTNKAPEGKSPDPTWVDRLGGWAQDRLDQLRDKQQREIDRLLNLLEHNPDEGLRFALPIGGGAGGRGAAPPGDQLGRRDIDFKLGNLDGGRPNSPWVLGAEQIERLMRSYRQAANRELNLGRHRRAAYIFGNLLNDFDSAANALEQGGFFREAAVLYQKHINDERAAASCLRRGGLFEEAIRIYEQLNEFEIVGDLHAELGHDKQAAAAFEKAVAHYAIRCEPLRAQQLLEGKLGDPKRALEVLLDAYEDETAGSIAALRESFQLRERHGWHNDAHQAVVGLRNSFADPRALFKPVIPEVLRDIAKSYGQAEVANAAADATRVLVGLYLERQADAKPNDVLKLVQSLEPDDLLLERDTRRFSEKARQTPAANPPPPANADSVQCVLIVRRMATTDELEAARGELIPAGAVGHAHDAERKEHWVLRFKNGELYLVRSSNENVVLETHHLSNFPVNVAELEDVDWDPYPDRSLRLEEPSFLRLASNCFAFVMASFNGSGFRRQVSKLVLAPMHTRPRLAVSLVDGAGLAWLDRDWRHLTFFSHNAKSPALGFTRNGYVAAADERFVRVFSLSNHTLELKASVESLGKPRGLLSGPNAGEFRVIATKECFHYGLK